MYDSWSNSSLHLRILPKKLIVLMITKKHPCFFCYEQHICGPRELIKTMESWIGNFIRTTYVNNAKLITVSWSNLVDLSRTVAWILNLCMLLMRLLWWKLAWIFLILVLNEIVFLSWEPCVGTYSTFHISTHQFGMLSIRMLVW